MGNLLWNCRCINKGRYSLILLGLMLFCRPVHGTFKNKDSVQTSVSGETIWITSQGLKLKARIYKNSHLTANPTLVVILHGDSPFGPPAYQYAFARKAAEWNLNVVAAAILRPGYTDDVEDHSDGERGLATGDNYTPQVVDVIALTIKQLTAMFHPAATVLVGHSGGAAITGNVLGRWPSVVNAALMVSCPCELAEWRKHMFELQGDSIWKKPIGSLSPIDLAGKVGKSVPVYLVVGADDQVAPARFTRKYAEALKRRGANVHVTVVPGLKHDILLEPIVFEQLSTIVMKVQTTTQ